MAFVRDVLEGLCYSSVVFVIAYRWWKKRGLEMDHVFLFSCGFVFYLLIPISLGTNEYFSGYGSPYVAWKALYSSIPDRTWAVYFLSCLLLYGAFIAGDAWSGSRRISRPWKGHQCNGRVLNAFLVVGVVAAVVLGLPMLATLFDYGPLTRTNALGSFTAAAMLILTLAVLATADARQRQAGSGSFWRAIANRFSMAYLIIVAVLIASGGRVIIFSSVLALLALFSVYVRRLQLWHVVCALLALIVASHAIELYRINLFAQILNPTQYTMKYLLFHLFSENFNVSHSLLEFLHAYAIPYIRFPLTLLTGMIGLIPSFVFPHKLDYVIAPPLLGYQVNSPNGGMHAFVSLMVDFGVIGSMAFLFCVSWVLQRMKRGPLVPYGAMYALTSGWLALLFFRDTQQTLIKAILEFSILVPLAVVLVSGWLMRRRGARASNSQSIEVLDHA
ncbi:hypothetical protein HY480_00580 [Candidatus Uhrbacteria bacterium]|nr:hypothetical protein [Candidatus Uhrbacteria bacterium]